MPDFAPGLPDMQTYGDIRNFPAGELVPYAVQLHRARSAGKHYDIRVGGIAPGKTMSFATRKELPSETGQRISLFQTPLHRETYNYFQGEIPKGFRGAGSVRTHDLGSALIHKANDKPDRFTFTVAHRSDPQRYTIVRRPNSAKQWLLINTTPGKLDPLDRKKIKYQTISNNQVDKILDGKYMVQPKIDGAAAFYPINGKVEAHSYRESTKGRPIIHTERLGIQGIRLPNYKGTLLRGEIYGEQGGEAIAPQAVGGILNSTIERSLRDQQARKIHMKNYIFDVLKYKGRDVRGLPYEQRYDLLKDIVGQLPEDKFQLARGETDVVKAKKLIRDIMLGKNKLTQEGVVAHPLGGGTPIKLKKVHDVDVRISGIFPGTGKYKDYAGGFEYMPSNGDKVVGKVGIGMNDYTRKDMMRNPEKYIGRRARIRSRGQFDSGAHRAPSFIALHGG